METKRLEEKLKEKEEKEKREKEALNEFTQEKNKLISEQKNKFINEFINNKDLFCLKEIKSKLNKRNIKNLINELNLSEQIPKLSLSILSEKALFYHKKNNFTSLNHLNIILIGPTGVGKSTLINAVLELSGKNAAKEKKGKPCTSGIKIYESNDIYLRLVDTKGIEKSKYGIDEVVKSTENFINKCIEEGDPDRFIHCIWYCVNGTRLEDIEVECLEKLSKLYNNNNLPIIVVYTKAIETEQYNEIGNIVYKLGKGYGYIPVIAKAIKTEEGTFKQKNLEELKNMSIEKAKNAIQSACFSSLKKNIQNGIIDEIKNNTSFLKKLISDEKKKLINLDEKVSIQELNEIITKIIVQIIEQYLILGEETQKISNNGQSKIKNFINKFLVDSKNIFIDCLEKMINEKSLEFSQEFIDLQQEINSKHQGNLKVFQSKKDFLSVIKEDLLNQVKSKAEYYCLKNAAKYIIEPIQENFELNYEISNNIILHSREMNKILELITKNKFNKIKQFI